MEEEYKESEAIMKKFAPLFEELGKTSMFFSNIEFIITETLTYLINERELFIGFTIINEYPIYKKIDLLGELIVRSGIHRITNEMKKEFLKINKELGEIRIKRNNLIHRLWILNEKDFPEIKQMSIKFKENKKENSFERKEFKTTLEEVCEVSTKARKIAIDLMSLSKKILKDLRVNEK